MTPKAIIAEIMERVVDRPAHNMLASEIVKKLDAAGYVIAPKEPTHAMKQDGYVAFMRADKTQVFGEAIADHMYRAMLDSAAH